MIRAFPLRLALLLPLAAAPAAAQTPIRPGETVTGTLEEGDPQTAEGAHYDPYVIRGRPGQHVAIRMSSEDFDTHLQWGSGTDRYWMNAAENDDWDGTDSRLVVRLGDEGEYELRAAGFNEDDTGAYELQVTGMPPAPVAGTIRPGDTVEGELAETDYAGLGGYQDQYAIRGREGDAITIYLQSDEFDPFVTFGLWRNGELDLTLHDDDSGPGTSAELIVYFYDGAEHRIAVRSYAGNATGRYTLRVAAGAASEGWHDEAYRADSVLVEPEFGADSVVVDPDVIADSVVYTTTTTDTIGIDVPPDTDSDEEDTSDVVGFVLRQPLEQWIGVGSPRDEEGRRYQEFMFRARRGRQLQFLVLSDEIHPILQVGIGMNKDFRALARDDGFDTEQGTEDLTWTVQSRRVYTLRVTAGGPGESGAYVLMVQSPR
jgi:hypothetical protein